MIARRVIDIGWRHLGFALWRCLRPPREVPLPPGALAALSVRSGFDALLAALALPAGSEVLMSAITVQDMAHIVRAHGLLPVPLEVDPQTLAVDAQELQRKLTPRSRVLLLAHLFGSRMAMEGLAQAAQAQGLLLVEDCAQAFTGSGYRGHARSDAALFSFGPIKTATALGGALLFVRDAALRQRVAERLAAWPKQPARAYARRCLRYALLKLLGTRPLFTLFCAACSALRVDREALLKNATKNFAPGELGVQLRQRPAPALVALMVRRWHEGTPAVARRMQRCTQLQRELGPGHFYGEQAQTATHWVAPLHCASPQATARALQAAGFDASRGSSSMTVIEPAPHSARWYAQLLYVPAHEATRDADMRRLAAALRTLPHPAGTEQGSIQQDTAKSI